MKLDVRLDTHFPRPPEAVWAALTDSAALAGWLMENDFEPVVGRRFTLRGRAMPGWRGWTDCQILALEPPRRMVWSWLSTDIGEPTTVVFELLPDGGGTRLMLSHTGETGDVMVRLTNAGWRAKMETLAAYFEADSILALSVDISRPRPTVWRALTDPTEIRLWWDQAVSLEPKLGGRFEERWRDRLGREVVTAGEVLGFEPPETLKLSWADEDWSVRTEVTFQLVDYEAFTALKLRHSGWDRFGPERGADLMRQHEAGWRRHLDALREHAEKAGD